MIYMFERLDYLRNKANHLPTLPGVYQMKDKTPRYNIFSCG